jgi:hypothetical protein
MKRGFAVSIVLISVHAVLVALMAAAVAWSDDPVAGMAWGVFYVIDYPIAKFLFDTTPHLTSRASSIPMWILALGTIQWLCVGLAIDAVRWVTVRRHRNRD